MSVYKVTRSDEYLMHKHTGPVKQRDIDGDGKLEWTEYGKAWRREQYRMQNGNAEEKVTLKEAIAPYAKAAIEVTTENKGANLAGLNKDVNQMFTDAGNLNSKIDDITSGKAYDRRRAELKAQTSKMSDEELRNKTNRMNLEKNYANAIIEDETRRGKVTPGKILGIAAASVATIGTVALTGAAIYDVVTKIKNKAENRPGVSTVGGKVMNKIGFV